MLGSMENRERRQTRTSCSRRSMNQRSRRSMKMSLHNGPVHTPNLPTKIIPARFVDSNSSGFHPMDLRIPPLTIKILLESNPRISRILVRRLAVGQWSKPLQDPALAVLPYHDSIWGIVNVFKTKLFQGSLILSNFKVISAILSQPSLSQPGKFLIW